MITVTPCYAYIQRTSRPCHFLHSWLAARAPLRSGPARPGLSHRFHRSPCLAQFLRAHILPQPYLVLNIRLHPTVSLRNYVVSKTIVRLLFFCCYVASPNRWCRKEQSRKLVEVFSSNDSCIDVP